MGPIAASRAFIVIIGAALILAGIGFAGYAIMLALEPSVGAIAAAAITAAVLLVPPMGYLAAGALRRPSRKLERTDRGARTETAVLGALADIARDRPLLAVLAAAAFGGIEMVLTERRTRPSTTRRGTAP